MSEKNGLGLRPGLLINLVPVGVAHLPPDQLLGHLHVPGDEAQKRHKHVVIRKP
jgi:hypothetical protein